MRYANIITAVPIKIRRDSSDNSFISIDIRKRIIAEEITKMISCAAGTSASPTLTDKMAKARPPPSIHQLTSVFSVLNSTRLRASSFDFPDRRSAFIFLRRIIADNKTPITDEIGITRAIWYIDK